MNALRVWKNISNNKQKGENTTKMETEVLRIARKERISINSINKHLTNSHHAKLQMGIVDREIQGNIDVQERHVGLSHRIPLH